MDLFRGILKKKYMGLFLMGDKDFKITLIVEIMPIGDRLTQTFIVNSLKYIRLKQLFCI